MPAPIPLKKGKRFGQLTLVGLSKQRGKRGERLWDFRCDCGNLKALPCTPVLRGGTKSCGCLGSSRCTIAKGKRFGRLTVIDLCKERFEGRRVWRCLCDCGGEAKVTGKALRRRTTKSCGCLKLEGDSSHFPSPAEQRRRYKEKREIVDGGESWLSLAAAAAYLGVTIQTIWLWADKCSWLDGEGIQTRPLKDGLGRKVPYYRKECLNNIKRAKAKRCLAPEVPGFTYIGELAIELGITERTVNKKLKRIEGVKKKKILALGKDSQARRRTYVPDWACVKLGAVRSKVKDEATPKKPSGPPPASPGRPVQNEEVIDHALKLLEQDSELKPKDLFKECKKKFPDHSLFTENARPREAFRVALYRARSN